MRRGELEAKHYSEGEKELTTKNWASQGLFTLIDQSRRITTQEFNASGQGSGSCQEADQTLIKTKPQTVSTDEPEHGFVELKIVNAVTLIIWLLWEWKDWKERQLVFKT